MNANEELIRHFYTSFQNKNVQAMQDCYAGNATFNDPVFGSLNAGQVRSMWAMLIKNGRDLRIAFKNVTANETGATAEWEAWYTFSATGNKVLNQVKASFIIENGKIVKHTDQFSFYKWARQALGLAGLLLGWTNAVKSKIRTTARKNLEAFMAAKKG